VANAQNTAATPDRLQSKRKTFGVADPTKSGFLWLSAFFIVYCARPEDWIPGLSHIPLAKMTGILAILALLFSLGRTKRTFKDVPKEGKILLAMIILLLIGAPLSPVWKGGAVSQTIDFAKVFVAWILTFLFVTTFDRLRSIIFIQTISVTIISVVSIIKGRNQPRLEGVIGGIYSNSNDLAFAVVLTLPFALAFLITSRSHLKKVLWFLGILTMLATVFLTASRAGFIDLVISGAVTIWHFGVRGKRYMLIAAVALATVVLMAVAGGKLRNRFEALSGNSTTEGSAYGSYEQRKYTIERALVGIEHYPIFGIGVNNFNTYSGVWREVHMAYLEICVEGGIPVLILYLMFFRRGFKNLKILRKTPDLDEQTVLFIGALHSSLVGFVVGALFAPEAYQFFPYFAIAFTATLLQTVKERAKESAVAPVQPPPKPRHLLKPYPNRRPDAATSPS
jgi:hypothetical protein